MAGLAERRPELVLAGVTLLWGSTFIVTKDVVRAAPPLGYLGVRFGAAALLLLLLVPRSLGASRRLRIDGLVLGFGQGIGLALQVYGQVYTTASKSAFVTSFATALTPLLAFGFYKERPSVAQALGVPLALFGLLLLTYPSAGVVWNLGDVYTVLCALVYAGVIVETVRRARGADVAALTTLQTASAALFFVAAASVVHGLALLWPASRSWPLVLVEARPLVLSGKLALELAYMALVCTVATFLAQTWAMSRMSATHSALVFSLEPVFATGMAIAVEGSSEWPGPRGATGAGLVLAGVLASELRRFGPGSWDLKDGRR